MNAVIGESLLSAVGIALSPLPLIAVILMLRSPHGKRTSAMFLLGWLVGILVAIVAFTALSSIIPASDPAASRRIFGAIAIVLGAVLILLAAGELRGRTSTSENTELPRWLAPIDSLSPGRAGAFGFVLAVARPKNLLLAIVGGATIGAVQLEFWQLAVCVAIFVVVASATVWIPIIAFLAAPARLAVVLESLHQWLVRHNSVIVAAVLTIVGVVLIGAGIAGF
ncbi:MAG TPA: GAP family protein [Microbacteriaceae bacterium]